MIVNANPPNGLPFILDQYTNELFYMKLIDTTNTITEHYTLYQVNGIFEKIMFLCRCTACIWQFPLPVKFWQSAPLVLCTCTTGIPWHVVCPDPKTQSVQSEILNYIRVQVPILIVCNYRRASLVLVVCIQIWLYKQNGCLLFITSHDIIYIQWYPRCFPTNRGKITQTSHALMISTKVLFFHFNVLNLFE